MSTPVQMPKLGESIVEGTVSRWLKAAGDPVAKLEPLLEISTDKIDTEIPSPAEGILTEIIVAEGTTVKVGTTLALIGSASEKISEQSAVEVKAKAGISENPPQSERPSGRAFISPVVGKLAKEYDLDLAQLSGSGLGGRITKKDVLAFVGGVESGKWKVESEDQPPLTSHQSPATSQQPPTANSQQPTADELLQPLTTMRKAIAQHMLMSKQTSPHVTTIFEVDMSAVVLHREANRQVLRNKGINLTYTAYFAAAAIQGLRSVPLVNGRYSEQGIVYNRRIHLGIATAIEQNGEDGLLVPVIWDADEKNLDGLARAINDLSERARSGKLSPGELSGGTFTLTNHGVGGSLVGTPIINQPQAAILGIGAIVKRPVVRNGNNSLLPSADDAIVIRPMCYLRLSFDHRILDGASADRFLTKIKNLLENWEKA